MKKKLLLLVLPFFLISCGMNETPDKVLMKNQSEVLWNITKFSSEMSEWEQLWKIKADIQNDKIKTNFDFSYKLQNDLKNKKTWWSLSWNVDWIWSWTGKNSISFDIDFLNTEKKLYAKMNKKIDFDIWDLFWMKWIDLSSFIWKWFYLELPTWSVPSIEKYNSYIEVFKKYQILKLVKKNEDKKFYNYDITLNSENLWKISSEIYTIETWTWLSESDKKNMVDSIEKNNLKWNIKISPKNKWFFILTSQIEKTYIKIENSKELFTFSANEEWNKEWLNLEIKKEWNIFNWKATVKEYWKDALSLEFVLKLEKDNINIKWKANISKKTISITWEEKNENIISNFDVNIENDKNAKIDLKEPTDASNLQETIMKIFMWSDTIWWTSTWSIEKEVSVWTWKVK